MWSGLERESQDETRVDDALNIAIDFDETITRAPRLWGAFIDFAKTNGHHVVVVTFRFESGDNADVLSFCKVHGIDAIFTGGRQKAHIVSADVWIDDSPITIPGHIELKGMSRGCERGADTGPEPINRSG